MRPALQVRPRPQTVRQVGIVFFVLLALVGRSYGQKYFAYSPTATDAYHQIFSLRFQEAQRTLVRLKVDEPDNQIYYLLRNYIDCLTLFIGEQTSAFDQLKRNKQLRLEELRKGDKSSPYYLYSQADIYLQWAITRVKFSEYFQAVMEIKRAFRLLERNNRLFPDFMPNKKNLGLMHALIGTVPEAYRWGVQILGMSGTIDQGKSEIEEVLAYAEENDFIYEQETRVMYAYLLLHLKNSNERAWEVIQAAEIDPSENPLGCFVEANIAMQSARNDQAVTLLEQRPSGAQYFPFPYLEFMLGVAKLNQLDPDAELHLQHFLEQTNGLHYIKETYQKLAWHGLIHSGEEAYRRYMSACLRLGRSEVDEDLAAMAEAESGIVPHVVLLKARVLSDGGYYEKAAELLEQVDPKFDQVRHQIEFRYRLGRIRQALGREVEALHSFAQTIEVGADQPFYFACNAAVLSGNIYEQLGRKEEAISAYKKALDIRPNEYRLSLHQKAKAGLNRLEER